MFEVALIGAGRIGRIHAANAAAHPGITLKYVIDPVAHAAEAIAGLYGAFVATLEDALADPKLSGVIIASSTDRHLDQCLAAAAAGKVIFCEKPLDLDLERVRAATPALNKARLFLGFNRRFDPNFQAFRSRLMANEVGRLESLQITSHDPAPPPVSYVKVSGGLFKDMAIHDFDMARWMLPDPPVEIFAMAACLVDPEIGKAGDVDTAKTIIRSASGQLCVISNSRRSGYGYDQRMEAFGSTGMLKVDNVICNTVQRWTESGPAGSSFQNFFLDRYADAYRLEMEHFAEVLAGGNPAITFTDGLKALELAEAAGQSLATGKPVSL